MIPLNTSAPRFELTDVMSGDVMSLSALKGNTATVIAFICNHCPFVKHINSAFIKLALDYQSRGISFVAISSNDAVQYPDDGPQAMKTTALSLGYPFPYLYDETQEVAKAYQAACTPDFFVFDHDLKLVYRGQLDDSRPGNEIPVTGKDMRDALDCLISGKPVAGIQKPSIGCNIKWKH